MGPQFCFAQILVRTRSSLDMERQILGQQTVNLLVETTSLFLLRRAKGLDVIKVGRITISQRSPPFNSSSRLIRRNLKKATTQI
jgi:hypothetical protein